MDSLTTLVSFVRTAEMLSFVQASQSLGISASAVGKNVARLENKLGVRLFNRSTRSVSLTSEGVMLLERCRHILEQLREAEAELTTVAIQPTGKIRVSLPAVGYHLLMPLLPTFSRLYPGVEIDLDFSDRLVNVIEEGFDIAIRSGELRDSRLIKRTLGNFRFVLCASSAYLNKYGTPSQPEDLQQHHCILFKFPYSGAIQEWELSGVMNIHLTQTRSTLTLNNIEAVVQATTSGMGISYLPEFVLRQSCNKRDLVEVMADTNRQKGTFSAIWPANRHLPSRVRCFIDFLTTHWIAG